MLQHVEQGDQVIAPVAEADLLRQGACLHGGDAARGRDGPCFVIIFQRIDVTMLRQKRQIAAGTAAGFQDAGVIGQGGMIADQAIDDGAAGDEPPMFALLSIHARIG